MAPYIGHAVLPELYRRYAGKAVVAKSVTPELSVRSCLAHAVDGAVDDARIHRLHGIIAQPEALHSAPPQAVDDDVGLPGELQKDPASFLRLEVQSHALLSPVPP